REPGTAMCPAYLPVARAAAASAVEPPRPIGSEPWFPTEGGPGASWTRANADCRLGRNPIVCELVVVRLPLRLRDQQGVLAEVDQVSKRRLGQSVRPQLGSAAAADDARSSPLGDRGSSARPPEQPPATRPAGYPF